MPFEPQHLTDQDTYVQIRGLNLIEEKMINGTAKDWTTLEYTENTLLHCSLGMHIAVNHMFPMAIIMHVHTRNLNEYIYKTTLQWRACCRADYCGYSE